MSYKIQLKFALVVNNSVCVCIFNVNLQDSSGSELLFTKVSSMQCWTAWAVRVLRMWHLNGAAQSTGQHIAVKVYASHTKVYESGSESTCITFQSIPYDTTQYRAVKVYASHIPNHFIRYHTIYGIDLDQTFVLISTAPTLCEVLIKTPFTE